MSLFTGIESLINESVRSFVTRIVEKYPSVDRDVLLEMWETPKSVVTARARPLPTAVSAVIERKTKEVPVASGTCPFVLTRGPNKGNCCGKKAKDTGFCTVHSKDKAEKKSAKEQSEKPPVHEFRKHKLGCLVHAETGLVIESNKNKVIIGRVVGDKVVDLDEEGVALCNQYAFVMKPKKVEEKIQEKLPDLEKVEDALDLLEQEKAPEPVVEKSKKGKSVLEKQNKKEQTKNPEPEQKIPEEGDLVGPLTQEAPEPVTFRGMPNWDEREKELKKMNLRKDTKGNKTLLDVLTEHGINETPRLASTAIKLILDFEKKQYVTGNEARASALRASASQKVDSSAVPDEDEVGSIHIEDMTQLPDPDVTRQLINEHLEDVQQQPFGDEDE